MLDIHDHRILILDFGSQYTQLIARRIREIGVYCEIYPYDVAPERLAQFAPKGVVLSGGPESVTLDEAPQAPTWIFESGLPILGICYGMQTMAAQLQGQVAASSKREFGHATINFEPSSPLFAHLTAPQQQLHVWMSHGDKVTQLPQGFHAIAHTSSAPIAAMACEEKKYYGVQFHPEVTHTEQGLTLLKNFVVEICGCDCRWTAEQIVQASIDSVRQQVGSDEVLLGLSGGVDSSVVAALLHQAIGEQLTCVFVDNGLLRLNEGDQVMQTFADNLGVKVIRVNAEERFLNALKGIADPELKRKKIGNLFIEVFEEQAADCQNAKWLAQGTIYPDVIESAGAASGKAHVIKSHHNVGGLPEHMQLKLVEPLRELFKDEVRRIGEQLNLPHELLYRHPFPGPGLGVRILGEVTKQAADVLRLADDIFIQELRAHHLYDKVSQAFAVYLPVKSVGVTGDARCYEPVVALRAVETVDFMTAKWSELPYDFLAHVSNRILNEVPGLSRVTYDISGKRPATIEWE